MNAKLRALVWTLTIAALMVTDRIVDGEPAPLRMLALIVVLFLSMKAIVLAEDGARLTGLRRMAFVCGWFGMRPEVFAKKKPSPGLRHPSPIGMGEGLVDRVGLRLIVVGLISIAAGVSVIEVAAHLPAVTRPIAVIMLFVGCSLVLHFGILNICAGIWRQLGFDCRAIFRAPWQASSLAEFWGRRWNVAFSEMISIAVVRPLAPSIGGRHARLAGFVMSGLMHEVAITLPVHSGYGLPTLYFLIQALMTDKELRTNTGGSFRRGLMLLTVLVPVPLVFPTVFVNSVVWPLVRLMG